MSLPITTTWTHLRNVIDDKSLPVQYEYNSDGYEIFAVDNGVIYQTVIYNNSVPDPTAYPQVQNDADKADFLANYEANANQTMQAFAARDGYIATTHPLLIAGKDLGGLARIFATNTSGQGVFVGAGTAGTPAGGVLTVQGDPAGTALPITGTVTANAGTGDFTVVQATASNLNAQVQGTAADGAAPVGNPVLIAGQDGTNVQSIKTDTTGRVEVTGGAAVGAPPVGNPVVIGGWDGTNVVRLRLNSDGTVATSDIQLATFVVTGTSIVSANNKSMISILNEDATLVTKIHEIYVINVQTGAVTGVAGAFELRRITGHSAGTVLTSVSMDTADTLDSDITIRTGSTVAGESATLMWRSIFSTDDWGPGTLDTESNDHIFQTMFPIFSRKTDSGTKPLVLRTNEGLTVKFATNSTTGAFDIMIVFTQE